MKASNRSSIITGTVLLVLAALFSISLIIQPLDFGIAGPGHNNIFYALGRMLYVVYGFSSILIPVFLLIAGISCFATKWTSKKTMRLITALVPFFTAVLTEKICRASLNLGNPNSTAVKISIAIVTGVLLIAIEIIGAGIIAESVNQRIFYRNKKPKPANKLNDLDLSFSDETSNASSINNAPQNDEHILSDDENSSIAEDNVKTDKEEFSETDESSDEPKKNKIHVLFDKALERIKSRPQDENSDDDDNWDDAEDFFDEDSEIVDENLEADETVETSVETNNQNENTSSDSNNENSTVESVDSDLDNPYYQEEESQKEDNKEENQEGRPIENPASIISQEEYAALIQNDLQDETEETEPEEDELEWPNLPPKPETLPPEYTEDFDEDDPALEFPPKDESYNKKTENFDDESDSSDTEYTNNTNSFEYSESISDDIEFEETAPETPSRPTLKYSDAVNENPAFPHGITIHDEDEEIEEEEKAEPVPERKYPVKISLGEDTPEDLEEKASENTSFSYEEPAYIQKSVTGQNINRIPLGEPSEDTDSSIDDEPYEETESSEETVAYEYETSAQDDTQDDTIISDIIDDYEEDITLPEPDYDKMEEPTSTLDSDFFDIDMNAAPDSEELSDDLDYNDEDAFDDDDVASAIFEQISTQESKPKSITSAAQTVFSDMEADIRKEQPKSTAATQVATPQTNAPQVHALQSKDVDSVVQTPQTPASPTVAPQEPVQASVNEDNSSMSLEPPLAENTLNPNAHHATNLTADELTDFFNAQQEQNTPVTTEIQANPPKTNKATKKGPYIIPSDLLTAYKDDQYWIIDDETKQASINLKQTLSEFNIEADIIGIKKGPVVTMFELLPAPGVKLSKIVTLQDNIALSLAAQSVRIVAPIPGKQAVGIEVPNRHRSVVGFREIIEMNLPEWNKMAVPVVLGKDILGKAQLIDLVKTPHMLIAGATGSGKSVCVNSLILSILYKRSFKDVKLILVDPKVVELKLYNNIPHLLTPVITEPKKALQALQYCLCEMERRYALLDGLGVRDISSYNQRIKERNICTEKLPYIVVIIDEFADLMATSGKELESIVARLTAMSRAVGIHLVLATQRPSVNVITGLIKANIPTRIAFMVASRTDSNIIIDSTGAEKLLGRGDMLYASAVDPYPIRIQGTFVTDQEVEDVVNCVKQYGEPDYIDDEIFVDDDEEVSEDVDLFGNAIGEDPLYDQALEIVVQAGKASASYIQRRLKIGYNRAARLVEEMEERGIVGPANGSKPREVIHIP